MRRRNTYTGRTLARKVKCCTCHGVIEAGQLGYKKHHQMDLPDWKCEACIQ